MDKKTADIILFPGGATVVAPPTHDEHAYLAGRMAESIRDYRNRFGLDGARKAMASQAYVLGLMSDGELHTFLKDGAPKNDS